MSSKNHDINSTEKLLNVIRGKDKESFSALGKPKVSLSEKKPAKKINIISPKLFFDKKLYTVGVDIDREFILLVKTAKDSGGRQTLVDQKVIKYGQQQSQQHIRIQCLIEIFSGCLLWFS